MSNKDMNSPAMQKQSGSKPRILVVAPLMHYSGGHFNTFARNISCGFSLNHADVTLLYPRPINELNFFDLPIKKICVENCLAESPFWFRKIWRLLEEQPIYQCLAWLMTIPRRHYDLVYWTDFEAENQRRIWPLAFLMRLGLYSHRTAFTEHHAFSWKSHAIQRWLFLDRLRLSGIQMIVHSAALLEHLRITMRWPTIGKYIPWGLWPNPVSEAERALARQTLEIPDNGRVLLVFGTQLVVRKQIDILADAVAGMALSGPLIVICAGKYTENKPHPFLQVPNKDNLTVILDLQAISEEKMREYFSCADIVWTNYIHFIAASGVLTDAFAHGRPVIGCNVGEIAGLIKKYECGLVCPPGNKAAIEETIQTFLEMPISRLASMSDAARVAAQDFIWSNIAKEIMNSVELGAS